MAIARWNGNKRNLPSLPNWFDDFWNRNFFDLDNRNFSAVDSTLPSVNVKETEDNYEVEVAAPGMDKKDFHITLDGNLLTISSEKQTNDEQQKGNYTRREFSYQSFQRSFELPKDVVDEQRIEAKYNNGVLHLVIPKKEEAKTKVPKMIEVR